MIRPDVLRELDRLGFSWDPTRRRFVRSFRVEMRVVLSEDEVARVRTPGAVRDAAVRAWCGLLRRAWCVMGGAEGAGGGGPNGRAPASEP